MIRDATTRKKEEKRQGFKAAVSEKVPVPFLAFFECIIKLGIALFLYDSTKSTLSECTAKNRAR